MNQFLEMVISMLYFSLVFFAIVAFRLLFIASQMKSSQYRAISGNSLFATAFNKGNYGEFLTFRMLEKMGERKILTNIYLPKEDGTTTEIDLLLINTTGIYVFESKNYSGWIFGDEKNKNWTQSLQGGKKNKFFNPIWQNKGHITAIDHYLEKQYSDMFHSFIVFSERCELKKITTKSDKLYVVKRNHLVNMIRNSKTKNPSVLTENQILAIYQSLKKRTLADKTTKQKHIESVKLKQTR